MTRPGDHRTRYELLFDRRRALRELERLAARLSTRDVADAAGAAEIVQNVKRGLCAQASQADCAALLQDVRAIYQGLVALSRLWVGRAGAPAVESNPAQHSNT